MQMRHGHQPLDDVPLGSSGCTAVAPASYRATRIWSFVSGFVWGSVLGFNLMNGNLFCDDFPAVFQQTGMWQHGVSSQSEASQTSSYDKRIFISHTYSRPTFSKLSWLFFLPKSALYPPALSRGEGSRSWHEVSWMSFCVQHRASERGLW